MATPDTTTSSAAQGSVKGADLKDKSFLQWRTPDVAQKPTVATTPQRAWLGDAGLSAKTDQYIDLFAYAEYDINASTKRGVASKIVKLRFEEGPPARQSLGVDIDLDTVVDDLTVTFGGDEPFFYLGPGDRVFPTQLARGTTPRLWDVKRQVLHIIDELNVQVMTLSVEVIGLFIILPALGLAVGGLFGSIFSGTFGSIRLPGSALREREPRGLFLDDWERVRLTARQAAEAEGQLPPATAGPGAESVPRFALLPNGKQIQPDHFGTVYHGTDQISPEQVLARGGLPPKGVNRSLLDHKLGRADSAFRGVTDHIVIGDARSHKGAAFFATDRTGKGWVYEIRGRPVYDLETVLTGRVERIVSSDPMRPFAKVPYEGEIESVIDAEVPSDNIVEVYEVRITEFHDAAPKIELRPLGFQQMKQARAIDTMRRLSGH